ncbi:hypothetical protein [Phreatobacter stygius]|uniref:YitH acetyltransferase (GNAT) domain-containing protein n=1 Tax=Phreatobacter stygius TaxID=1940610 RepID=A0A4D7B8L5_9HYPH|nr:hypothetical protein [Phreatobacter stygius]QCI64377.1 hypothetical protein E8M01_09125 [Phreatobacter stygius]
MESVHALLARGFPSRHPSFWVDGLKRQADHHARIQAGPVGQILRVRGADVGVILTMRSRRADPDGRQRKIVNLSSWYVDEVHRWLAPSMLKAVLSEPETIYTDLTPSDSVERLNARLGLTLWNDGVLLVALPFSALHRDKAGARLVGLEQLPRDRLSGASWTMLEDHAAMGCITAALDLDGRLRPLIFARTRRKGLPAARVIYADSKSDLKTAIGAVSRFLLLRGIVSLEIPARHGEHLTASRFSRGMRPTFARGTMDPDTIDHAYSEFVLLRY